MKRKNAVTEILDELGIPYVQDVTGTIAAYIDGRFVAFVHSSTDTDIGDKIKLRGGTVVDWQEPISKDDVMRVIQDMQRARYL